MCQSAAGPQSSRQGVTSATADHRQSRVLNDSREPMVAGFASALEKQARGTVSCLRMRSQLRSAMGQALVILSWISNCQNSQ
jgi:hypothetical protein